MKSRNLTRHTFLVSKRSETHRGLLITFYKYFITYVPFLCQNRYKLTFDQTDKLVALCYLLSPDVLLDKVFFHSEEMCDDMDNRFLEVEVAQSHLAVAGSIIIGGKSTKVQSIMVFQLGWIERNWATPIKVMKSNQNLSLVIPVYHERPMVIDSLNFKLRQM